MKIKWITISFSAILAALNNLSVVYYLLELSTSKDQTKMQLIQFVISFLIFSFLIYKYLKLMEKMKAIQAISKYRNDNFLLKGLAFNRDEDKQYHLLEYYEKEKKELIDYLYKNELKSLSYSEIEKIINEVL